MNKRLLKDLKKFYTKSQIKRYFNLILGLLIFSIGFNLFILPNSIVSGGVSGLSIITNVIFDIDPSLFIFCVSFVLLIISFFVLGKDVTKNSLLGSLLLPIFIKITSIITLWVDFNSNELLLSAIFGGVLLGLGLGLIFKAGFTTGGTDIINQIIHKYFHISIGSAILITDTIIIGCGALVFGLSKAMYAIVIIYIISLLTDKVLLGISDSKAFYIVTNKDKQVKNYILDELGHGVTVFDAEGGFTKGEQEVLFCVIPTKEYFKLKEKISSIDKKAFFVVTDAYEVFGGE